MQVRRGRGPQYLRLLVEHGADLEHKGGETWRGSVPLRTAFQHAVLRGREDSARTLAELGAEETVDPDDLAVAAIARGERPERVPETLDVDGQEVVILAALRGHMELSWSSSGRTSAASSAARQRGRCSSTCRGSARRRSRTRCSRRARTSCRSTGP